MLKKPSHFWVAAIVVSTIISLSVFRFCSGTDVAFYNFRIGELICGDNKFFRPYNLLQKSDVGVTSHIAESPEYSLKKGFSAKNLVDGDPTTLAYPGSLILEYVIDLINQYDITKIAILWGGYGTSKEHIEDWEVSVSNNGKDWNTIAQGDFPGEDLTTIKTSIKTRFLKLIARSKKNWIGAYEVKIIGRLTY